MLIYWRFQICNGYDGNIHRVRAISAHKSVVNRIEEKYQNHKSLSFIRKGSFHSLPWNSADWREEYSTTLGAGLKGTDYMYSNRPTLFRDRQLFHATLSGSIRAGKLLENRFNAPQSMGFRGDFSGKIAKYEGFSIGTYCWNHVLNNSFGCMVFNLFNYISASGGLGRVEILVVICASDGGMSIELYGCCVVGKDRLVGKEACNILAFFWFLLTIRQNISENQFSNCSCCYWEKNWWIHYKKVIFEMILHKVKPKFLCIMKIR